MTGSSDPPPCPPACPSQVRELTVKFAYNDLDSVRDLFARHPGQIACVVLEAATSFEPSRRLPARLRRLCDAEGALLIFDEMITGFRWHLGGAQAEYDVTPDLSAFGKALGNGFAVSALAGRRDLMELGGIRTADRACSCCRPRTAPSGTRWRRRWRSCHLPGAWCRRAALLPGRSPACRCAGRDRAPRPDRVLRRHRPVLQPRLCHARPGRPAVAALQNTLSCRRCCGAACWLRHSS